MNSVDALARDKSDIDHWNEHFKSKIPFLNGGLFDPIGNYDWVHTDINIPNELFSNTVKTKEGDSGNGILDTFDRFNFTVKEDEPLEKEVAIDPELLGKAYEKFNAIRPDNYEEYKTALKNGQKGAENKFNKKFGVYYTPREIVHYMCQQSLINYLHTELNKGTASFQTIGVSQTGAFGNEGKKGQLDLTGENRTETKVSKEDIEILIKSGEQLGENEAAVLVKEKNIAEGKQQTTTLSSKLPESIRENAGRIDYALANITVCDPAIGSGAFPVGMMHEIVKTRNLLSAFLEDPNRTVYSFKRECIEKSLYGVDIDPGAVEIAKLRLWLSLVVDEEDIRQIKPLPNLDYKIVCGNSLLGYPYQPHGLDKIEQLKKKFFDETRPTEKNELRKKIDYAIHSLFENTKKSLGYKIDFDFKINFSEVFHYKSGFDIIIANPPYGADLKKSDIKTLIKSYKYFDRQKNSASFFLELAVNLCDTKNGSVSFIVPKSLSFSEGWKSTRKLVSVNNRLSALVDVSKAFENVLLEQIIVCFQTGSMESDYSFVVGEGWHSKVNIFSKLDSGLITELDILPVYLDSFKLRIYSKMITNSVLLSEISDTFRGLPAQRFVSKKGNPILRGKNIGKYSIYGNIDKIPGDEHDNRTKRILQTKIVSQNIVAHVRNPTDRIIIMASIDTMPYLTFDTVMNTIISDKNFDIRYILAIINSTLASWFYYWFVYNRAIRTMHFDKYYLGKFPIKIISKAAQKPLIDIVDRTLAITKDGDYKPNPQKQGMVMTLEREIDQFVYQLYDLTEEEIRIVEQEK